MDSENDPGAQLCKYLLTSVHQIFGPELQPLQLQPSKGWWRNTGCEFTSPTFHSAARDEIPEVNEYIQFSISCS